MFIKLENHKFYGYTAGKKINKKKPTIIFVHGAANDHSVWSLQSRYFSFHNWNSIAVDLPGHGKSQGPLLDNIGNLSDWLNKFLTELDICPTVVVGHSMGSLIAIEFAANFRDKISGLVLVGTASPMPVSENLLLTASKHPNQAYQLVNNFSFSAQGHIGPNAVPGAWIAGAGIRLMERSQDQALYKDFVACNTYLDGLSSAKKITCPSLLISGLRDKMTPPKLSIKLLEALSVSGNCQKVNLESGHSIMAEKPDEVLNSLINFTKSLT